MFQNRLNTKKIFDPVVLFISVIIIFLSIFPWSIRDFPKNLAEAFKTYADNQKNNFRVFPKELYEFALEIEKYSKKSDRMVFISRDGKGEKEFFLLSYYLYPQKVYRISDLKPGPISWWVKNDMSFHSIVSYMDQYKIGWITTYDFNLSIPSNTVSPITKAHDFELYRKI